MIVSGKMLRPRPALRRAPTEIPKDTVVGGSPGPHFSILKPQSLDADMGSHQSCWRPCDLAIRKPRVRKGRHPFPRVGVSAGASAAPEPQDYLTAPLFSLSRMRPCLRMHWQNLSWGTGNQDNKGTYGSLWIPPLVQLQLLILHSSWRFQRRIHCAAEAEGYLSSPPSLTCGEAHPDGGASTCGTVNCLFSAPTTLLQSLRS